MCGVNHVQTSVTLQYATVSPYNQSNLRDKKCVASQTASCATTALNLTGYTHWITCRVIFKDYFECIIHSEFDSGLPTQYS